ncbi:hypothetical protein PYW07_013588 [Mythimna separata]|uniref:Aprataxin and PNK-like factor n=1 Tax=Mythimna separata TaxID=271217 RepID=A0AAD7YEX0_MYTSE|nr:hypothetical protein PYW07_013588 [Mythimna separata]
MVFKLVRIDAPEPCKIQLTIGTHVIGRGKFLHNDESDKRVSRNHAELVVTPDTVSLKSLHQNPCFFMKKSIEMHLLHQDTTVCLCHGDKFGLLPEHFWYEVLHCPDVDSVEEGATISETTENGVHTDDGDDGIDSTEDVMDQSSVTPETSTVAEESINFDGGDEEVDALRSASPSLLTVNEEGVNQATTEPELTAQPITEPEHTAQPTTEPETAEQVTVKQESVDQDDQNTEDYDLPARQPPADDARTPTKRERDSSSEPSPVDVKKVKIERDDAGDSAAGPSNGQASSDNDTKDNIVAPAPQPKPAPPARERCIYGANCYRRNPQHKAQFSHPSDADWGAGERGVCPYGAACRKADPRHWANHTHPPGMQPPSAHAPRPGHRRKRRPRRVSVSDNDEDDSPVHDLIVTGKRARKTVQRQDWSDAGSEDEEDPYGTDESDEWQPPSDVPTSQDFSQDL